MATVINPFAVSLNKNHGKNAYQEMNEVTGKPVYRRGDYTIWKQEKKFYNTCYKNIIITQTVGAPKELCDALYESRDVKGSAHFHLQRMRKAIMDGMAYAKENNIEVISI